MDSRKDISIHRIDKALVGSSCFAEESTIGKGFQGFSRTVSHGDERRNERNGMFGRNVLIGSHKGPYYCFFIDDRVSCGGRKVNGTPRVVIWSIIMKSWALNCVKCCWVGGLRTCTGSYGHLFFFVLYSQHWSHTLLRM